MAGPFDPTSLDNATAPVAQQAQATEKAMPQPGSMAGPYAAIGGANAADYLTTLAALRRPGVHESNPLMQNPLAMAGVKGGTTLAEMLIARALNNGGHPTAAKIVGYGAAGLPAFAAIHNTRQGR